MTLRHASIVRDSSPPEADLASDVIFCPGDGASRSSTRSAPAGPDLLKRLQLDGDVRARAYRADAARVPSAVASAGTARPSPPG